MALILDTRTPLFVLVGQFNKAIFQPIWIAKHLFDKQEGEEMSVVEVVGLGGNSIIELTFFDDVAFVVNENRLDVFVINGSKNVLEKAESVTVKLLNVLSHTPVSAIGCNLNFVDTEPQSNLVDMFETREGFEGEGRLNLLQNVVQFQIDADSVLNLNRTLSGGHVRISFNYHRNETDIGAYAQILPGFAELAINRSRTMLLSYYGIEVFETVGFSDDVQREDVADVDQAAN